ncbi:hypothetical protein FA13DRAFT_1822514 [Coprinellus micaceus]|uniref:G domain-containing protein n=1 Tax=Coprinellus micaceus TaxID=71717 RepID=A0A4Y7S765_COPMI|nr:hypothetical protein FA13DRAFT_1822514 [Coprinellus micaceus]
MLRGIDEAPISSKATGCTLSSTPYEGTICDQRYTYWDTAGLNETDVGKVPDLGAVGELYRLLQKLEGGVSLLVFCMRKPKSTWSAAQKNWQLFKHIICQNKVPVVIAVTHLEQEPDMDEWWQENYRVFVNHDVIPSPGRHREYEVTDPTMEEDDGQVEHHEGVPQPDGAACITATKGKMKRGKYSLQEEYDQSCWKVKKLVYESHLATPWKVTPVEWFKKIVRWERIPCWYWPWGKWIGVVDRVAGQGVYSLMERWGLGEDDVRTIIETLQSDVAE